MKPDENVANQDSLGGGAPTAQTVAQSPVADLSQNQQPTTVDSIDSDQPVAAARPPAVQPTADGAIIAPVGTALFAEPSLVKPKSKMWLVILAVAGGAALIGGGILIFFLLNKE